VLKQIYFWSALFWTGLIIFVCLIKSSDIPQIDMPYLDKVLHACMHFVFTLLWFFYFKKRIGNFTNFKLLLVSLVLSVLFGIVIELIQKFFTVTRNADLFDVIANLFGASLAVVFIINLHKYTRIFDKF
jgi:VanZ family protein